MVTVQVCLLTEKRASRFCKDRYPASFDINDVPYTCSFCQKERTYAESKS